KRVDHRRVLGDAAEALRAGTEVVDLGHREDDVLAPRTIDGVAEIEQPVPVAVREGSEQHATHDAEDRGVRANAEAEREDDREAEAAGTREAAEGVAEIGDDHGVPTVRKRSGKGRRQTARPGGGHKPPPPYMSNEGRLFRHRPSTVTRSDAEDLASRREKRGARA